MAGLYLLGQQADEPRVRDALLKVTDFWLEAGVDGLRLDAIPVLSDLPTERWA